MTEDNGKTEEWKYDFAWKQLENAQTGNDKLDNKAMSIINFSSLIIPIITGVLLFVIDKSITIGYAFYPLLVISLILLLGSIWFAFKAIRLKDQGVIHTEEHFNKIGSDRMITKILGNTAQDLAAWQEKVIAAGMDKGEQIEKSSNLFMLALTLIILSAIDMLLF